MWLEKVYRKQLITSTLRKDLLQIDGLYARISKLRYELCHLKKKDYFELCGTCVACKDEGQKLELKEKEKWYVDEVKSCLLYTSPSPRDGLLSRMPSSA